MAATSLKRIAALCVFAMVSACTGSEVGPTQPMALGCVDDSPHCINERSNALKGLMADKSKTWVRSPASPAAYATGVRLWAFKQRKRELTCDELSVARREADNAAPTLRSAKGQLTPAQISRGIMLAQEVSRELGNEAGRRCRA